MSDEEELRGIQDVANSLGVTTRTLRFYEDRGLIEPRRVGTARVYSKRETGRMQLILRGKRFGFSLEDIRQLLDLYDLDDGQLTQVSRTYEIGHERLAAMTAQRDELNTAIAELSEQLRWGEKIMNQAQPRKFG